MNKVTRMCCGIALACLLTACSSGGGTDDPFTGVTGGQSGNSNCTSSAAVDIPFPDNPLFTLDPLGPMRDVSCDWQRYQPASAFCVRLDAPEFTPGGSGKLVTGADPVCANSGFGPQDENLFKVEIETPILCPGCRRLFIDTSQIPPEQSFGHAFYAIVSFNPSYTIDPIAHSPNTKNFTNDHLVSPPGTPIATVVAAQDTYSKAYVTHTTAFAHTDLQGPYYVGPWYVNRQGQRIHGFYLDVDVGSATPFGNESLDALAYMAGYNNGLCPDALVGMAGANFFYGGCVNNPGISSYALYPFP